MGDILEESPLDKRNAGEPHRFREPLAPPRRHLPHAVHQFFPPNIDAGNDLAVDLGPVEVGKEVEIASIGRNQVSPSQLVGGDFGSGRGEVDPLAPHVHHAPADLEEACLPVRLLPQERHVEDRHGGGHEGNRLHISLDSLEPFHSFRCEPVIGGNADDRELVGSPLLPGFIIDRDPGILLLEEGIGACVDLQPRNAGGKKGRSSQQGDQDQPPPALNNRPEECDTQTLPRITPGVPFLLRVEGPTTAHFLVASRGPIV